MRTTIALDDDLISRAQEYTGLSEKSALVREALKALIEREAARRLAALGGSQPGITVIEQQQCLARGSATSMRRCSLPQSYSLA